MHTNQTSNFLLTDNPQFPFPNEVKPFLADYKWDELVWNAIGLPAHQCEFSLSGGQLYFEKDARNQIKVRKENFTGQCLIAGVLSPKNADLVYFLQFELYFCDGLLSRAELISFKTENAKAYEVGYQNFKASMEKNSKRRKSWWFRFLYIPYYLLLSVVTMFVTWVLKFALWCIMGIYNWLTPFKV